jgi:tripartite-type tricarboxylate transporter receptor subunit TctC
MMRLLPLLALPFALCVAPLHVQAQAWPTRPVTLVVPTAAGGSADSEARLYANKLTENNPGRQFLVEAKPGAGTTIGTAYVAKSAPDGHTLLMVTSSFTIAPAFYKNLPYDSFKDFAPASLMSKRATVLVMNPGLPIRNMQEYVAYAKAHPGEINFATTGGGSIIHLAAAWMEAATNTRVTYVHYKGIGMYPDLFSGRVNMLLTPIAIVVPHIKAGKLRVLAVTSGERSPLMPDLPTLAEQGIPGGVEYPSWLGVMAPAGTPAATINRISSEFAKLAKVPDIVQKMVNEEGNRMYGTGPEPLRQLIQAEIVRWQKLVQDTGIKLEE